MNRPKIIQDITPDFDWESKKIWSLDLPVEEMEMEKLLWHFDYPFWEKEGTDDWNLTPWELIEHPEQEPTHYAKIKKADLAFPIEIMEFKGKYRILDGIHRLAKAYLAGKKTIKVRIVPPEQVENIRTIKRSNNDE